MAKWRGHDSWGDAESWECCLCATSNWAKKKQCRNCSARKTFAQALGQESASKAVDGGKWWYQSQQSPPGANSGLSLEKSMTRVGGVYYSAPHLEDISLTASQEMLPSKLEANFTIGS